MTSPALDALCLRCRKKPDNVLFTRDLMGTGVAISVFCHGMSTFQHVANDHLEPFFRPHARNVIITLRPFAR